MPRYPKGSNPKLSKDLISKLSILIKNGAYIETAAAAVGISKDSFYRWLRNGKKEEGSELEKELSYAVMQASAISEINDLEIISKAAKSPNGWKAAAWRLERKFPEKWGRLSKGESEVSDTEDNEIRITFVKPGDPV